MRPILATNYWISWGVYHLSGIDWLEKTGNVNLTMVKGKKGPRGYEKNRSYIERAR